MNDSGTEGVNMTHRSERSGRWRWPSILATATLSAALLPAAAVGAAGATPSAQPQPVATTAEVPSHAVGMGDSYMSGEGGIWSNRGWVEDKIQPIANRYWSTGAALPKVDGGAPNEDGFYSGFVYGDAGGYQSVDSAESDPFCHRSAWMPTVGLTDGGVNLTSLNLACSGALADTAEFGGITRPGVDFAELNGVKGQATRLQEFAAGNDVSVVALSLGGNDLGFATIASKCVNAYGANSGACNSDPELAEILASADEVKERLKTSIANIVQAMRAAGKADGSWKLVYQSPVLPIAKLDQIPADFEEKPGFGGLAGARFGGGCPLYDADWTWVTDTVFPTFVETMRQAIQESEGVLQGIPSVFLDHTNTFEGHRLCQDGAVNTTFNYEGGVANGPGDAETKAKWGPGNGQNTEWATGIVAVDQLSGSQHQKQNPLHPNYWGQRALSACLDGVLASGMDNKIMTCAQQGDGQDEKGRPAMAVQAVSDIWVPPTPSVYLPLPEALRLADADAFTGPQTKTFNVSALGEAIPDNATALALNITVANTTTPGYAQVFPGNLPDDQPYPTSVLNWEAGERLANGVSVKIADDGSFKVHVSQGSANVFIDVTGYYRDEVPSAVQVAQAEPVGTFAGLATPQRVFDRKVLAGGLVNVDLTKSLSGATVIADPSKVLGVVVNLTAADPAGPGHFRVQPSSQEALTPTSVVNWTDSKDVVANSLIITLGPDGKVKLLNGSGGPVRAVVDVTGVFVNDGTGAAFYPVDPERIADTREGAPLAPGAFLAVGTTPAQVPAEATGLAFNLTEDGGTSRGHMRAQTAPGPTLTNASIINWPAADHTRANASMLRKNASNGGFHVYNGSGTEAHAIVDLLGYFAPSAEASDTARFPIG